MMSDDVIALVLVATGALCYLIGIVFHDLPEGRLGSPPEEQPTWNRITTCLILTGVALFVAAGVVASL